MEPLAITGECSCNLIREYGVIHLRNALSEEEQKSLWSKTKPNVKDPKGKVTGFSAFAVSSGNAHRDEVFDRFGKLLFNRSAEELLKQMSKEDAKTNPLINGFGRSSQARNLSGSIVLPAITITSMRFFPITVTCRIFFLPCLLPSALT